MRIPIGIILLLSVVACATAQDQRPLPAPVTAVQDNYYINPGDVLDAVHGLLYLVVSLLSVALMFLVLGAPFAAAPPRCSYFRSNPLHAGTPV